MGYPRVMTCTSITLGSIVMMMVSVVIITPVVRWRWWRRINACMPLMGLMNRGRQRGLLCIMFLVLTPG